METSLNQTWATDYVKGVRGWKGEGGGVGVIKVGCGHNTELFVFHTMTESF